MKKAINPVYLIARYLFLILIGLFNLKLFYLVFTPLTVYSVYFIASVFDSNAYFASNIIQYKGIYAEIIPACVAGAAYYFLLILNFTTPMKNKARIKSILFLLLTFFIINILRIFFFLQLALLGFSYFDLIHIAVWYFGSTILVVLIWFLNVFLFKIKAFPVYEDIKTLSEYVKNQ